MLNGLCVLALVERVAPTSATVLIGGESGVGKDLVAQLADAGLAAIVKGPNA